MANSLGCCLSCCSILGRVGRVLGLVDAVCLECRGGVRASLHLLLCILPGELHLDCLSGRGALAPKRVLLQVRLQLSRCSPREAALLDDRPDPGSVDVGLPVCRRWCHEARRSVAGLAALVVAVLSAPLASFLLRGARLRV